MAIVIPFPKGKSPREALERVPRVRDGILRAGRILEDLGVSPAWGLTAIAAGILWIGSLPPRRRRQVCLGLAAVEREAKRRRRKP